jgi:hypothetical protein
MHDACMVLYGDLVPRFLAFTSVQEKWPATLVGGTSRASRGVSIQRRKLMLSTF